MRSDLFLARKCIHIKLTKEVHSALRAQLIKRGLTMQEVMEEISGLIASDDRHVEKILDNYTKRKLSKEIERLQNPGPKPKERIGELDQDALYDLINTNGTP